MKIIKTERLILRQWRDTDLTAFAQLNADSRVMEHFLSVLSKDQSDEFVKRHSKLIEDQGWGLWAVEVPNVADFIGFIGLAPVNFAAHFTPAVEVGWRLAHEYWGKGYASEGAQAAINFGFEELHLDEIVSFTALANTRSRRVMEKLHMSHNSEEDFDHPRVSEGHSLRRHVLYRLRKNELLTD
jgi:3-dehydroquinate dehydratase / shikimate dehydrogenase